MYFDILVWGCLTSIKCMIRKVFFKDFKNALVDMVGFAPTGLNIAKRAYLWYFCHVSIIHADALYINANYLLGSQVLLDESNF